MTTCEVQEVMCVRRAPDAATSTRSESASKMKPISDTRAIYDPVVSPELVTETYFH